MPVYRLYGFNVLCTLDFKGISKVNEKANITIKEAIVPTQLSNPVFKSNFFESSGHEILIRFRQQARLLISKKSIDYQIIKPLDKLEFKQFLIGPAFSALNHLNGDIPLHASAIIAQSQGILFAGDSGSGKSTVTASYIEKGFQMLADDVSLIDFDIQKKPIIMPSMPLIKLWGDSVTQLGIKSQKMEEIAHNCEKKAWVVEANFYPQQHILSKIFIIKKAPIEELDISTIKGLEKFKYLNDVIYRSYFTRGLQTQQSVFEKITNIAKNSEIFLITRPQHPFRVEDFHKKVNEFI